MTEPETTAPDAPATLAELAGLCRQRAATYGLLSRLYRTEVDDDLLAELHGLRFPASTGNEAADAGYRLIAGYLSERHDNALVELAIDYAHVFIGHGVDSYSAAYPYESVYTSEKRLLMQAARDEVLAVYRSQGLDKQAGWKEAEDHVAAELEFMQIMAERTADALDRGDEDAAAALVAVQRNFLADHLASWVPVMTLDVRKFANTDLYRGLAALTDGLLAIDGAFLADAVADDADDAVVGD